MTPQPLRIDIISDVVCPWCVIGYLQLAEALEITGTAHDIHWHPFELNPDMPVEGRKRRPYLLEKYGMTPEQAAQTRAQLQGLASGLGFTFAFTETMWMHNTFATHQLLQWAGEKGRQHDLTLALFAAHFTHERNLTDRAVLADLAGEIGLDRAEALAVLDDGRFAQTVRKAEEGWVRRGIRGVPAMVFDRQYLVTGAQGREGYAQILRQLSQPAA